MSRATTTQYACDGCGDRLPTKNVCISPSGRHTPRPLKQRDGDQPLPTLNDEPDIQTRVIADILVRRDVGISRYGTALQPYNGRDALRDAYEEALDLAMYLKQLMVERDENTLLAGALRKLLADDDAQVSERYEMLSVHAHAVEGLTAEERAAVHRLRQRMSDPGETMPS